MFSPSDKTSYLDSSTFETSNFTHYAFSWSGFQIKAVLVSVAPPQHERGKMNFRDSSRKSIKLSYMDIYFENVHVQILKLDLTLKVHRKLVLAQNLYNKFHTFPKIKFYVFIVMYHIIEQGLRCDLQRLFLACIIHFIFTLVSEFVRKKINIQITI